MTTTPNQLKEDRAANKLAGLKTRRIEYVNDIVKGSAVQQPYWTVIPEDVIQGLKRIEEGCVRLAFADPPYNQGIDYGRGSVADRLVPTSYLSWCEDWITRLASKLTPDGSLWLLISDEYAAEFTFICKSIGLHMRNWVIWHESFGTHQEHKFSRTKRHLLYFCKHPTSRVWNRREVLTPSKRITVYGDRRGCTLGKTMDDVWSDIPRVAGTHPERIPQVPTQLPLKLLNRIVAVASEYGDLVLDPFTGSGTTGEAAISMSRRFVGFELNREYADLASLRISGVRPQAALQQRGPVGWVPECSCGKFYDNQACEPTCKSLACEPESEPADGFATEEDQE